MQPFGFVIYCKETVLRGSTPWLERKEVHHARPSTDIHNKAVSKKMNKYMYL